MARKPKFVPTPEWSDRMPWPHAYVLGIDASMTSTGWSYVYFHPERKPHVSWFGNARTEATGQKNLQDTIVRGGLIFDAIKDTMRRDKHPVSVSHVAIECPVAGAFTTQARVESGPVMASACYNAARLMLGSVPIALYQPNAVKKSVAGSGTADKQEVKAKVFEWIANGEFRTNTDVTDSIAVAIHTMLQLTGVPDDY